MADMKRTVRAAAAQIAPDLESADGTLARVLETIRSAARQGVELIVFPETFVPYYPYFSFIQPPVLQGSAHLQLMERAPTVPGPMTDAVAAAAREAGMVVVLGVNERDHGSLYNTQIVFDADGRLLLKRRKITPTYHERMVWGQGDGSGLVAVDTRVGRVGALACWEHYNPLARAIVAAARERGHVAAASEFRSLTGRGVEATVDGECYAVGGPALLRERGRRLSRRDFVARMRCARPTLADVEAALAATRISRVHGLVHYFICDASGACAALEL